MSITEIVTIMGISMHWGFATGNLLAVKTDWSIPKFILLCLLMRIFIKGFGY